MRRFFTFSALCCTAILLMGCKSWHDVELAMYGSEENIQIARAESQARTNENNLKKMRELEQQAHALISEVRKQHKLKVRPWNEDMQTYVRMRAKEVSERFDKRRPNGEMYFTLYDEYKGGKTYSRMRELRARSFVKAQDVVNYWMRDEEARKILLYISPFQYAVGLYIDNGSYYWVFVSTGG